MMNYLNLRGADVSSLLAQSELNRLENLRLLRSLEQQQQQQQQPNSASLTAASLPPTAAPLDPLTVALLQRSIEQNQLIERQRMLLELQTQMLPPTATTPDSEVLAVAGLTDLSQACATTHLPVKRKGRIGTFPQKLHQMLMDLEASNQTDIASFLPHGRAFMIHKPREFAKDILPKYFKMSHFSSFQRQLNLYDFQRIADGPDRGSYFHELLIKNRPSVCKFMKRNKIKGVKKEE